MEATPKVTISEQPTGHTRFSQSYSGPRYGEHKTVQLDARRVRSAERNESQIEIAIDRTMRKSASQRTYTESFSLILSPEDARKLALTICPELAGQQ